MNCIVLEHARIGARSLVAANSTVLARTEIPPDTLAAGSPAKVKRAIEGGSRWWPDTSAEYYVALSRKYKEKGLEKL